MIASIMLWHGEYITRRKSTDFRMAFLGVWIVAVVTSESCCCLLALLLQDVGWTVSQSEMFVRFLYGVAGFVFWLVAAHAE